MLAIEALKIIDDMFIKHFSGSCAKCCACAGPNNETSDRTADCSDCGSSDKASRPCHEPQCCACFSTCSRTGSRSTHAS